MTLVKLGAFTLRDINQLSKQMHERTIAALAVALPDIKASEHKHDKDNTRDESLLHRRGGEVQWRQRPAVLAPSK